MTHSYQCISTTAIHLITLCKVGIGRAEQAKQAHIKPH